MNLMIFYNPREFFLFLFIFQNTVSERTIEAITVQVNNPKNSWTLWNLGTKT